MMRFQTSAASGHVNKQILIPAPPSKTRRTNTPMFNAKHHFDSQFIPARSVLATHLILLFTAFALCPCPVYATVRDVTKPPYNAAGDGVTDDTTAITTAIEAMQPGDTLLFPCTTSSTYLINSQLTIIQNSHGVLLSDVTVDGSGCAIIKDQYSNTGTPTGKIMVIGGTGRSIDANYGSAVALSAVANELSTSFTTVSSLAVNPGDYVYLCQGGQDGSATPGASCPQSGTNGICDPNGCRGEVLKVASVSGNAVTVTTALHDTYDPVANFAVAQKISNPLTGITVKNITFDGNGTNAYGLVLAGVAYSTVSGVTARKVQGAAIFGGGDFNVAWSNITVTQAGSEDCGAAAHFEQQGNLSVNTLSISQENQQQAGGSGTCFINAGAFGFSLTGSANSTITNLTVDATGAYGRPFKTAAARWNILNSVTVQNGSQVYDNGVTIEYYSSHNTFNECVVTNNGKSGSGTGNAGINLMGNFNQYNIFSNCTVTGNGNVQFYDGYFDVLRLGTDVANAIVGGTYTGSNTAEAVILLEASSNSVSGVTINGPGSLGIEMDQANGNAPGAPNACINNNVFVAGTGLIGGIYAAFGNDSGSGNQLNDLSSNLTPGTCTAP